MDEFSVEVSSLKHNFWQILNLSKQLLARNEVLKAKLKEQEKGYEWKVNEMQKTVEDLKRKNALLQKRIAAEDNGVNVIGKEFDDVVKGSLTPSEDFEVRKSLVKEKGHGKGLLGRNDIGGSGEDEEEEEEDEENYEEAEQQGDYSEENSPNSI